MILSVNLEKFKLKIFKDGPPQFLINIVVIIAVVWIIPGILITFVGFSADVLEKIYQNYSKLTIHPELMGNNQELTIKYDLYKFILYFAPRLRKTADYHSLWGSWHSSQVLFTLFLMFGLSLGQIGLYNLIKSIRAMFWPSVKGAITVSWLNYKRTGRKFKGGAVYVPTITYLYEVNQKTYTGTKLFFARMNTNIRSLSEKWVKKYPAGKVVDVYYNPRNPRVALLENKRISVFSLLFGILGLIIDTLFLMLYSVYLYTLF